MISLAFIMPFHASYEHVGIWQLLYAILILAFIVPSITLSVVFGFENIIYGVKVGAVTAVLSVLIIGTPIFIYRMCQRGSRKIVPVEVSV